MKTTQDSHWLIYESEFSVLVAKTYGRPYRFRQQEGERDRAVKCFSVPDFEYKDYGNDTVPERVGHKKTGVSFKAWLARDPKAPLNEDRCGNQQWAIDMWWESNFYPSLGAVVNDLLNKGLLDKAKYAMVIS